MLRGTWIFLHVRIVAKVFFVEIEDLKTGKMDLKIREIRQSSKVVPREVTTLLNTKKRRINNKLQPDRWYDLQVDIHNDQVSVKLASKVLGSFQSEGFAHPTKRMLRLAVPRQAVVDDLKIYSMDEQSEGGE